LTSRPPTSTLLPYTTLFRSKAQVARGIHFPQVTGAQPALFARWLENATFPVTCRDVFSADQDFPAFGQLEFKPWKDLAYGTFGCAKRMIQADQRSRFRHAISLDYGVAHALEETLG